ncbi:hypothetical protein QCK02_004835 [Enterobacter mori]
MYRTRAPATTLRLRR